MNMEIKKIIELLNLVEKNMKIYFDICDYFINNFDIKNSNYEKLENLNKIINQDIINDIEIINNDINIKNKFSKLLEINNKILNLQEESQKEKLFHQDRKNIIEKQYNIEFKNKENKRTNDSNKKNDIILGKNIKKRNEIYAQIKIGDCDVNCDRRIISSYEEYIRHKKRNGCQIKSNPEWENEKEIIENCII